MISLEVVLAETADHIDWPSSADLSSRVAHRLSLGSDPIRQPRRRWLPVAVALLVLVIGLLAFSPATRQAIADLLGVAGIRIELGSGGMEAIGFELDLGEMVSQETAIAEAEFPVSTPNTSRLSAPEAIFSSVARMGGEVTLTWAPGAALPEVGDSGVGLLISQFQADRAEGDYLKRAVEGTQIQVVAVSGNDGYWLHGAPHILEYHDDARIKEHQVSRLAGNVLIWELNGVTFRLESSLGLQESLAIAESMSPKP
ncbi:MAG: hypothetical protein M3P87_01145 [Actinomycetota bacterium]|nr:hypothetical protein [Actinomycetota bacterium]